MEKPPTVKTQRMEPVHYAQRFGEFCPYCRQAAVTADGEPLGSSKARWTSPMRCTECGARWREVHILIGYLPYQAGIDAE